MMTRYKIADLIIEMEPKLDPLAKQSIPYRYQGDLKTDKTILLSDEIFQEYREQFPQASDSLIEYMATSSYFYTDLIEKKGILLHASAVELDGNAYLFSAPSGTGKSTHTSLWLKKFGSRAEIINDDKPALRLLDGKIFAFGTPWSGKTDLNLNKKAPLKGICFLERSPDNQIFPMASGKAIEMILSQTVRPHDKMLAMKMLDVIEEIVTKIPIFLLRCNMDPEAATLSYETMSKGELQHEN